MHQNFHIIGAFLLNQLALDGVTFNSVSHRLSQSSWAGQKRAVGQQEGCEATSSAEKTFGLEPDTNRDQGAEARNQQRDLQAKR